jgi:hypothetical protein
MALSALICNMALGHCGTGSAPIEDPDTDKSAEARNCRTWYEHARKMCLQSYDWKFARTRATLTPHATDPATNWAYRYAMPANVIALRGIPDPRGEDFPRQPFKVEIVISGSNRERTILTNAGDAEMIYTLDITEADLFSPWFTHAFSLLLGHFIARPTTGRRDIKNDLWQLYSNAIRVAPAHDANEEAELPEKDASWIRDR